MVVWALAGLAVQFGNALGGRQQNDLDQLGVQAGQIFGLLVGEPTFQGRQQQRLEACILAESTVHTPRMPRAAPARKSAF